MIIIKIMKMNLNMNMMKKRKRMLKDWVKQNSIKNLQIMSVMTNQTLKLQRLINHKFKNFKIYNKTRIDSKSDQQLELSSL